MCTSDVYGLSHEANPACADPKFDPYFARMPLKAMSPEVLFESLQTATKADATARRVTDPDAAKRALPGKLATGDPAIADQADSFASQQL